MPAALLAALLLLLGGCERAPETGDSGQSGELQVWLHSGSDEQRRSIQEQVTRFNNMQYQTRINAVILPQGGYRRQVETAARSGTLPDIVELDVRSVYEYAWQGHLIPIDKMLTDEARLDLLPAVIGQGMYQGRIYALGTGVTPLGLFVRPSLLQAAGIRIPHTVADAWSAREFSDALAALAERDPDGAVLDLKLNRSGGWITRALAPMIGSAGGRLLTSENHPAATGALNGAATVAALRQVQSWLRKGYLDPNDDHAAFTSGRVAISWAESEQYFRYTEAVGKDLAIVPLPDFGAGTRTGQDGWSWAITTQCRDVQAAMQFLEYLSDTEQVLSTAAASRAVPATRSALGRSPLYGPGGPLHLFTVLLEQRALPVPRTPAYATVSDAFQAAFTEIRHGTDVQTALNGAAARADADIRSHEGYPPPVTPVPPPPSQPFRSGRLPE